MSGEGSVFRRTADGAWLAQLSTGGRGHRTYRTRSARTKAEARRKLDELKAERDAGLNLSKQSLGDYLRRWLAETARPTVRPNTLRGYEDALLHLRPILDIPLDRLTAEDVEGCCNRMTTHRVNAKGQRPASPKTVRNVQVMLRRALGQALDRGHVRKNVAGLVPLRRVPRSTVEALTPERARAILDAVAGDRYEAAVALGLVGLRSSEFLALSRADIDLDAMTVTIRFQMAGSGRRAVRVETKTSASATTIPLPAFVVERLRAHLARQDAERPFFPIDDWLVFVTADGYAVNGSWLTKHFQSLLGRAGLPEMRLHDLRHGAASLLVAAGAHPRVATEMLRHAPGSRVTMERYAHVTAAQQREVADLLDWAVTGMGQSVTQSVTDPEEGVGQGGTESPGEGLHEGESGSGGRIRTYGQAVNSRPLYH